MLADDGYDLFGEIQGESKNRALTLTKAKNDCNT